MITLAQIFLGPLMAFVGYTLAARLFLFWEGPRRGLKEEKSQKKLWFTSLGVGCFMAGVLLLMMLMYAVLGYFFPQAPGGNSQYYEFHPW